MGGDAGKPVMRSSPVPVLFVGAHLSPYGSVQQDISIARLLPVAGNVTGMAQRSPWWKLTKKPGRRSS